MGRRRNTARQLSDNPTSPPEGNGGDSLQLGPDVDLGLELPPEGDAEPEGAQPESAEPEVPEAPVARPGSLPTWWTDSYPQVTDVRSATAYLNSLGGAISREEKDGRWALWTAEQVLFEADSPEELDAFVLGFALSQLIADRHGPISQAMRQGGG
jgi:hypothetical protein